MFLDLKTKEKEIIGNLYNTLEAAGFHGRVLPMEKIKALHDYSWRNYLSGKIPARVNKLLQKAFPVKPSKVFDGAKSILLVSAADGYNMVEFDWIRKSKRFALPPAFELYRNTEKRIKKLLMDTFRESGFDFVRAVLPLKLLSSICSYLRYGSNRVAYAPHKNGTVTLFAFYTDLPYERVTENIYEVIEELCSVNSTTGFTSRENRFSISETRMLLESTPLNKFPQPTLQKIISTDLVYDYNRLPKYLWKALRVKPADFWKIDNYA